MKKGALLTHEQCSQLAGKCYKMVTYFIYDVDADGNYYLPENQITECEVEEHSWIKSLPLVDYQPVER